MNLDKHIVVKQEGTLEYSVLSPVYKAKSKYHLDENGYCGDDVIFYPPIEIKWKYSDVSYRFIDEMTTVKKIELEYDFGMPHEFFPEQMIIEHPDSWKYRNIDLNSPMEEVVKRYVEDQLIFALHRNPCELKPVHWALRGWLRGRATLPWHNQLVKL